MTIGGSKKSRKEYKSLCRANDDYFKQFHYLKPATLSELIDKKPGTGSRTLLCMLNNGPRNDEEKKILDHFVWKMAVPMIKHENLLLKRDLDRLFESVLEKDQSSQDEEDLDDI